MWKHIEINVETSNYKNIVFINTNYCMIKIGVMYFEGFKSEEVVNLKTGQKFMLLMLY